MPDCPFRYKPPGGSLAHRLCQRTVLSGLLLIFLLCLVLQTSIAADLSRNLREGRTDVENRNGGYLELGAGYEYRDLPIVGINSSVISLQFGLHAEWNGAFLDISAESFSGFQLGYNFYNNGWLSVDVLGAVTEVAINDDLSEDLEPLRNRDAGINLGFRATASRGDNMFQFEMFRDISNDHGGHVLSSFAGRTWFYRNWNLHAIVGGRYWSEDVMDYVVGVRPDEANERFPVYRPPSGFALVAELGATYPIAENWVFRGTLSRWKSSSGLSDSPFITDDDSTSLQTNLYFVY